MQPLFLGGRFLPAAILFAAAVLELPLAAQPISLDPFLVSAVPLAGQRGWESQQLALDAPLDLGGALARAFPAAAAIRKGPVAGDFLLRGLGRDNIALTLDGCTVYGACPNRMDPPAFHLSSQQLARISVRPGPFDVDTGASPGGIIRLETRGTSSVPSARLDMLAGSFGARAATAGFTGALGGVAWQGGAFYRDGGVYADGNGVRFTDLPGLNYRPEVRDDRAFLLRSAEMKAGWTSGGAGAFAVSLVAGVHEARDVLYPGLKMDARLDASWRMRIALDWTSATPFADRWTAELVASGVYHDMTDARRTSSATPAWAARGYMMRTEARTGFWSTRVTGSRGRASASGPAWRFGLDAGERRWDAANTIMAKANPMLPDVLVRRGGAFAVWETQGAGWRWELGGRLDGATSEARKDLGFVQGAQGTDANRRHDLLPAAYALVSRQSGGTLWFAGLGHAPRLPDPQERYTNLDHPSPAMRDWVGNPQLDPVRATEAQAGLRRRVGLCEVRASVFHSWLQNYILPARLVVAPGAPANATMTQSYTAYEATLWGGDAAVRTDLGGGFRAETGAAWQRGRKRGGIGRDLAEIPPLRGRTLLGWSGGGWRVEGEGELAARQNAVDASLGEFPLPGYAVWHLHAAWSPRPALELAAGVDNVFDRAYAVNNAYVRDPFAAGAIATESGRAWYARLSWRF